MKKLICACLALLLLAGCSAPATESTINKAYVIIGATTAAAETDPAPTETTVPAATSPAAPTPPAEEGYLQKVVSHDQPIFSQPTYDSAPVGTVEQAGTYTILEEVTDSEGNLWGKLKSGAGWVDLTAIRKDFAEPPAFSCGFASESQLKQDRYYEYAGKPDEAHIPVIFHAYEQLTDVKLLAAWWDGDLQVEDLLYSLDVMDADKPLVANLSFPGDMTMFVFEFTDAQGARQVWRICESGRNGALECTPVTE